MSAKKSRYASAVPATPRTRTDTIVFAGRHVRRLRDAGGQRDRGRDGRREGDDERRRLLQVPPGEQRPRA